MRLIILMLFLSHVKAIETIYRWKHNDVAVQNSHCFEIDKSTLGDQLNVKVDHKFCRPKTVALHWVQDEIGSGKCYEIDEKTRGLEYFHQASSSNCIPSDAYYKVHNGQCFALAEPNDSQNPKSAFSLKVSMDKCIQKDEFYYAWKNNLSTLIGECWKKDLATKGQLVNIKMSSDYCYPKKSKFIVEKIQNKSVCAMVDSELGATQFIHLAPIDRCKDLLKFELVTSGPKNICFIQGEPGSVVDIRWCKPSELTYLWRQVSAYEGECLEKDLVDANKKYQQRVSSSYCYPENKIYKIFLESEPICVLIDQESLGKNFSQKVSKMYCDSLSATYSFKLSATGIGGECFAQYEVDKNRIERVLVEKCKPEKTKYLWIVKSEVDGECFEVDFNKGHNGYSTNVSRDRCRVENLGFILINDSKGISHCYEYSKDEDSRYILEVSYQRCVKNIHAP